MNNEYEEANVYVDEEVNKHKKKTSAYMDAVKLLVFISLLSNLPNFKDKFKELTEKYKKDINNLESKGYKGIEERYEVINLNNNGSIFKPNLALLTIVLNKLKLDKTSSKTAEDLYIKYINRFYDRTKKTIDKVEYLDRAEYLSKKVSLFDKVEKVVRYSNGSYYGIDSYTSMVYNTNLVNKGWQETIKRARYNNTDLVYVYPHPYSCELCQQYQGKTLSITGSTPGLITLDEAIEGGLKHPNCKHVLFETDRLQTDSSYSGAEWTEKYNAKQKKQALELKKSRLLNDKKIYKQLGDEASVDETNKKIKKLREEIRVQEELM